MSGCYEVIRNRTHFKEILSFGNMKKLHKVKSGKYNIKICLLTKYHVTQKCYEGRGFVMIEIKLLCHSFDCFQQIHFHAVLKKFKESASGRWFWRNKSLADNSFVVKKKMCVNFTFDFDVNSSASETGLFHQKFWNFISELY
jgi:hypothetical protein